MEKMKSDDAAAEAKIIAAGTCDILLLLLVPVKCEAVSVLVPLAISSTGAGTGSLQRPFAPAAAPARNTLELSCARIHRAFAANSHRAPNSSKTVICLRLREQRPLFTSSIYSQLVSEQLNSGKCRKLANNSARA
jgi:hypothetical protein